MATATIHDLDDASLLGTILDFLPGHFRFVASVNRRFRFLYHQQHTPTTTLYIAAMTSAATRGIWLQEDPTEARESGCRLAAKFGNLEALRWFHSHDCRNRVVCTAAAAEGHLHILQWARSQTPPCPWDERTCLWAASNGRLDVLQWLRSQTPPCPWNEWTCLWAASNGRLDVLQWLRSQTPPCPWNEDTCTAAAEHGHLDTLQWLRSQTPPCPWHIEECLHFVARGSEVDVFIRSQL